MRQLWILAVATVAIAGCASERDDEMAAMWRHQDGTAVSGAEVAQARTACVRAGARELAPAETDFRSDPVFHPGGEGLNTHRGSPDLNSPTWRNVGRAPIPLAACFEAAGLVRAATVAH
jgi:hypothetical protein